MKILFLTTKYPLSKASPYLTNEICDAFRALGHSLTVVNLDWNCDNSGFLHVTDTDGDFLNIMPVRFRFLPKRLNMLLAWSLSSIKAFFLYRKHISNKAFNITVITTPMTLYYPFLLLDRKNLGSQWVSFCWDFFPAHQAHLGLIPAFIVPVLKRAEEAIFASCTKICTLSEDYVSYLMKNFRLPKNVEIVITGLWGGDIAVIPNRTPLYDKSKVIVFGGQFSKGRGNKNILGLCLAAAKIDKSLRILLIGSGESKSVIAEMVRAAGLRNLIHSPEVDRSSYNGLINGSLAGLISLDGATGCPSFPSKIVDYLRNGLPIVVIDNNNESLRKFVEDNEIGFYVQCGDSEGLEQALRSLVFDRFVRARLAHQAISVFQKTFSPIEAARIIVNKNRECLEK